MLQLISMFKLALCPSETGLDAGNWKSDKIVETKIVLFVLKRLSPVKTKLTILAGWTRIFSANTNILKKFCFWANTHFQIFALKTPVLIIFLKIK